MLQTNSKPIVFAEWSAVNGRMMKRRDFELSHMLAEHTPNFHLNLFDGTDNYETDTSDAVVLKPIREFAPIHYRRVQDNG
jgi:hypothetical protein